ncbi:hypothetical protein ISP15_08195 [Dyella jejuensis]|uniref:Teneurin-like YD-shell domain-containing protein n=1 Tax=Dyella jejuensis TaxID=1432009 RepID=A0ABW8JGU4_9GAMM
MPLVFGALLTPCIGHAQAVPITLGNVDGVFGDGNGAVLLKGWACWKYYTLTLSSPQVDVYVGGEAGKGGVKLGTYNVDQPSEPEVSQACENRNSNSRFIIAITIAARQQYGGQRLYVYGSPFGKGISYTLLSGSGEYAIPIAPAVTDSVYYVHTDRLGSNVIMTDANANVVLQTDYKAYGAAMQQHDKQEAPGFTGSYEDPLTGLTYMQARYYDADLGRFISIDPVPAKVGDLYNFNRYVYAKDNPLTYLDSTGMSACIPSTSVGGGAQHSLPTQDCGNDSSPGGGLPSFVSGGSSGNGSGGGSGGVGVVNEVPVVTVNSIAVPRPLSLPEIRVTAIAVPNPWLVLFLGLVYPENMASCRSPYCHAGLAAPSDIYAPHGYANKSTESKPKGVPPGTIPIDDAKGRYGWDKDDVHNIKDGIGAGPKDWTGVSPDGRIWGGDSNGDAVDHGNWEDYL